MKKNNIVDINYKINNVSKHKLFKSKTDGQLLCKNVVQKIEKIHILNIIGYSTHKYCVIKISFYIKFFLYEFSYKNFLKK